MSRISLVQLAGSVRKFNLNRPFIRPILRTDFPVTSFFGYCPLKVCEMSVKKGLNLTTIYSKYQRRLAEVMMAARLMKLGFAVTYVAICIATTAQAEASSSTPAKDDAQLDYPVSELYVVAMEGASIEQDVLTLSGLNPKVIWFTGRPKRESGRASFEVFVASWPMADDSFKVDPPNAVLVGTDRNGDDVEFAMELTDPVWVEGTLKLRVLPLSDPLPELLSSSAAHLFIDNADALSGWCGHECFQPVTLD